MNNFTKFFEHKNINKNPKQIYLLWSGYTLLSHLKGIYTTKKQANYYCKELNKINKDNSRYFVLPFYINDEFCFTDNDGNLLIKKYNPKKN